MAARIAWLLVAAAVMAAGTMLIGWWTIPLAGLAWGMRRSPVEAGLAGGLAWGALLGWQALRGPLWVVAERAAGVLAVPAVALPLVAVAFAGLLGWSAAGVGRALAGPTSRQPG